MARSNIRFYWFSATHAPAPPPLLALGIETPRLFAGRGEPAVAFLSAAEGDEQRFLSAMSAELGAQAYVVFLLAAPDPARAAALLDLADEVCTLQELAEHGWAVERATRQAQRKAAAFARLGDCQARAHHVQASLDVLPIPIFFKDAQGVYLGCNQAFENYLGRRADEIIGRSVFDISPAPLAEVYAAADRKLMEEGGVQTYEARVRFADGSLRDVEFSKAVFRDETGKLAGLSGAIFDISARKQAEAAQHESEQRYRDVFKNASDAIHLIEVRPDGKYIVVSQNAAGERVADLVGGLKPGILLGDCASAEATLRRCDECVATGTTIRYEESYDFPSGQRSFLVSLIPVRASDGSIHRIVSIGRDISEEKAVEKIRQARERDFRSLFDNSPDAIVRYDPTCRSVYANQACAKLSGLAIEACLGKTPEQFGGYDAQTGVAFHERLAKVIETGGTDEIEIVLQDLAGEKRTLAVQAVAERDPSGNVASVLTIGRDLTERIKIEEQLRVREREFRTLVENSPDFLIRYDRQGRRQYANPAAQRQFAKSPSFIGNTPLEDQRILNAEEYMESLRDSLELGVEREGEFGYIDSDSSIKNGHFHIVPEFDDNGNVTSSLCISRDITEIVESRKKIQRLAFYDSLTGLPNRALLNDRIRQLAADASRLGQQFGLMMLDLDRFKEVNDTLGHAVGDALLRDAVARLRTCVRASDVVARLGGDEFAILLPGMRRKIDFGVVAAKILRALAEPFYIAGREINISGSVGIAKYPKDSAEIEVLFKQADSAMYHAKKIGRNNFQFYAPEMMERTIQRMMVETTLRKAQSRGELELYYQPQVTLPSGKLLGAESLLRWNHPELGFLTPNKFISIAEDTGTIVEIGRWVLFEACRTAVEWNTRRAAPIKISVNLSSRQFVMNDLVTSVREAIAETGCQPEWLELEITESLLLEDNEAIRSMLEELSRLGLSIAMDDFGIGYSALGYLTRFPIDTLKIDRSFIHDIDTDAKKLELVKAIIGIARALELRLVAEGVETKTQADFLVANGCHVAQGYLYGRPMSRAAFGDFLRSSALQSPFVKNAKRVSLQP